MLQNIKRHHIVSLDMKGCVCHFTKWQIHPFVSKGIMSSRSTQGVNESVPVCVEYLGMTLTRVLGFYRYLVTSGGSLRYFSRHMLCPNVQPLLEQRLRRWPNSDSTLVGVFCVNWYFGTFLTCTAEGALTVAGFRRRVLNWCFEKVDQRSRGYRVF